MPPHEPILQATLKRSALVPSCVNTQIVAHTSYTQIKCRAVLGSYKTTHLHTYQKSQNQKSKSIMQAAVSQNAMGTVIRVLCVAWYILCMR